jgi:hypothetical protein
MYRLFDLFLVKPRKNPRIGELARIYRPRTSRDFHRSLEIHLAVKSRALEVTSKAQRAWGEKW